MRDRKRRSKTENGIFPTEEKGYLMRPDIDDFRAAFFNPAFSIATSYRNGGDFRSEKMAIGKYCATRYQGVCMAHSQKPRENTRDTATQTHQSTKAQATKVHKSIRRHMIVEFGLNNTAVDMHSSVVATTDGCCCTILLPPTRRAAVCSLGFFFMPCTHVQPATAIL